MPRVHVTGWKPGFNKVGSTKAIRAIVGINLAEAKAFIDAVLAGDVATIDLPDNESAAQLVSELEQLGAIADSRHSHA